MSVNKVNKTNGSLSIIAGRGQVVQFSVMPVANASRIGQIVQYTGTTTTNYSNGYFYKCVENSGSYEWQNVNVQASGSGGSTVESVNGKTGNVFINTIDVGAQATIMPTADAEYENKIIQYIGTNGAYTNGYFYKCVDNGGTYTWEQVNAQPQITVDSTLSSTSENPVQNKVIYSALDDKVDKVTGKDLSENDYTDADKAIVDSVTTNLSNKADKVSSATNGDLAGLNSSGNLTDSGILATNVIVKSNTAGLVKNDGTIDTTTYLTSTDIADKANKVTSAVDGDLAGLDSNGDLTDSGISANDVATKVSSAVSGHLAGLDGNGDITDSGIVSADVVTTSSTAGLIKNDGTIDTNTYATTTALGNKADKVTSATANDFAALDSNGNLIDSGINKNIVPSGATSSNQLATANDIPTELNDLSVDVEITSPVNAQVLTYNSTSGKWENQTGSAPVGGATFQGSILFANLPTTGMANGDWYDIKDAFTTDNRFEEGSGIACAAGTDVIWVNSDSKWNILTPSGVFSFNGRTGAVSPASGDYSASGVTYSNTTSGLTADDVQEAIDEVNTNVSGKANKVSGATNGNFAGLDSNGNLTDSGSKASDFSTVKSRQTPASGGTTLSLVNTGDMYNWDNKVDSVSVGSTGTASGSTVAYQRIGVGDASGSVTYTEINGTKYMELTTPSSSSGGVTSFVFTNNVITHTALYDIYSNVYGVAPINVVAPSDGTTHTLTVNFNSSTGVTACRVYIRG